MIELLKENWMPLLLALMGFLKVVVNLTPSEKDNKIFSWVDSLIDMLIPNLKAGGGKHKKR